MWSPGRLLGKTPKVLLGVFCLTVGFTVWPLLGDGTSLSGLRYVNTEFGFQIDLPESWRGYSVLLGEWTATNGGTEKGPTITLRHPAWTAEEPREDMPIMVFTHSQWDQVQNEDFRISAAPIPPSAVGQNSEFVLALPPRWDFDQLTGVEEVGRLVHGLVAFEPPAN